MDEKSVDLRELGNDASLIFGRVQGGETLTVTDHGRAIARIVPFRASSVLDQLMEDGEATTPTISFEEFLDLPIPLAERGLASVALGGLRENER